MASIDTPSPPAGGGFHPAVFVLSWMFFSNVTILFNKYLLDTAGFPITLTALHLATATLLTQLLARYTTLIPRQNVSITGRLYLRTILPIGLLYTVSLVCSNLVYLTLSVAFIQMLKAIAPVTTLLISWAAALSNPKMSTLCNILVITAGVFLASVGEVSFAWSGFLIHMVGTVAESCRLLLIQTLLKGGPQEGGEEVGSNNDEEGQAAGQRGIAGMNPLVGLYYFAPACAILNGLVALVVEMPRFDPEDLYRVGVSILALNSVVAFMLNVAGVFLIGRTSALVMNLTGILKSIILVGLSTVIWATPVTLIQLAGYGVALAGMFYYALPPEGIAPQIQELEAWLDKVLVSDSEMEPRGPYLRRPRFLHIVRKYLDKLQYIPVSSQNDEEGQQGTIQQGEMKDGGPGEESRMSGSREE